MPGPNRVIPPLRVDPDGTFDTRYWPRTEPLPIGGDGPEGPEGPQGPKAVIVSTTEPPTGDTGELWYNPEGIPAGDLTDDIRAIAIAELSAEPTVVQAAADAVDANPTISSLTPGVGEAVFGGTSGLYNAPAFARPPQVPRHPKESVITTFGTGHGWTSPEGVTQVAVPDDGALADQSVEITVSGSTFGRINKSGMAPMDLANNYLRVYLKCDQMYDLYEVTCYAGVGNLSSYRIHKITEGIPDVNLPMPRAMMNGKWAVLTFSMEDTWTDSGPGTIDFSAITDLQLTFKSKNTNPVTLRFGGVSMVPKPTAFPNGVATFTHDDGWLTQYTIARTEFAKRGIRCTVYPIHNLADNPNLSNLYMRVGQLRDLQDRYGWDVGYHAHLDTRHNLSKGFIDLTDDELHDEYARGIAWLQRNGFDAWNHMAYPKGAYDTRVDAITRQYFTTSRTAASASILVPLRPSNEERAQLLIKNMNDTVAALQPAIDRAVASGSWVIFMGHQFAESASSGYVGRSDLAAILDYAVASGIEIRTVSDVMHTLASG